jgi:tetratricopeptide (TPR) repeat protein
MQDDPNVSGAPKDFVHRYLPWLVAAGTLVLYLITLNRWPSFTGLPTLAKVTGWDWRPVLYGPLHFLLTYPVRWLPESWQLVALNLFGALCSVLSLALLARSVALLPHDRTRDQRNLERSDYSLLTIATAWLPPVFAAAVCGLQLTFWENAVFSTVEALDLLLLAYVIRCLLEFRIDQRRSWIYRAAVVYGLGMTNNLAMIGFLPAFLVAGVWILGRECLDWRFLLRVAGCGLAGLLLYLLLPALNSPSETVEQSFWEMIRTQIGFQKKTLLGVPRYLVLLLSLTSVFAVLFIGIRWPAQLGDISAAGSALTNLMTHVIHGAFLLTCLYVAFDPPFSPRSLGQNMFAFLPFYYLGALTVGYCSGYFLLLFGPRPDAKAWQRPSPLRRIINFAILAAVWIGFVAVPAGLLYRNWPAIRGSNARHLSDFATEAAKLLPPQGAVVLSDDTFRLYALRAALARSGTGRKHVLLDTTALTSPGYHVWLRKRHPDVWPQLPYVRPLSEAVDNGTVLNILLALSSGRELYYLQPSFGFYFEYFYLKPRNVLYRLLPYPTNSVNGPLATTAELKENDEFWRQFKTEKLGSLIRLARAEEEKLKAKRRPNFATLLAAGVFSRALDYLGVQMQKAGDLAKAGEYFGYALELNTNSPSAFINLEYNNRLRAGQRSNPKPSDGVKERLVGYGGSWDIILSQHGPIDEPSTCYLLAKTLFGFSHFRQAAQLLERVLFFNPGDPDVRIDLAAAYVHARFPDKALDVIAQLKSEAKTNALNLSQVLNLAQIEAWAYLAKSELPSAEKILSQAQEKHPGTSLPFSAMAAIYLAAGKITNAIATWEKQLQLQTNNLGVMVNLAALRVRNGEPAEAIRLLDAVLEAQPLSVAARLNRARAHMDLNHLDEALRDFEFVRDNQSNPPAGVYFGLAEILAQRNQPRKAIEYYELYLKNPPANPAEVQYVRQRLKALKRALK